MTFLSWLVFSFIFFSFNRNLIFLCFFVVSKFMLLLEVNLKHSKSWRCEGERERERVNMWLKPFFFFSFFPFCLSFPSLLFTLLNASLSVFFSLFFLLFLLFYVFTFSFFYPSILPITLFFSFYTCVYFYMIICLGSFFFFLADFKTI